MFRWIAFAVVLAGCGSANVAFTSSTTAASTAPPSVTEDIVVPRQVEGLEVISTSLGERTLTLAVADTTTVRSTGLMFITDLDDLDGMVFVYTDDTTATFHMTNTLIPLDIAFFDADGRFVSKTTMTPCETDTCPRYEAAAEYRYAIEVSAGGFAALDNTSRLDVAPLAS